MGFYALYYGHVIMGNAFMFLNGKCFFVLYYGLYYGHVITEWMGNAFLCFIMGM